MPPTMGRTCPDLRFYSALGRIRTCNLLIRSQVLYPLSYERAPTRRTAAWSIPAHPSALIAVWTPEQDLHRYPVCSGDVTGSSPHVRRDRRTPPMRSVVRAMLVAGVRSAVALARPDCSAERPAARSRCSSAPVSSVRPHGRRPGAAPARPGVVSRDNGRPRQHRPVAAGDRVRRTLPCGRGSGPVPPPDTGPPSMPPPIAAGDLRRPSPPPAPPPGHRRRPGDHRYGVPAGEFAIPGHSAQALLGRPPAIGCGDHEQGIPAL